MSSLGHGRARRRVRRSIFTRGLHALWRIVRVILMLGFALGPTAPPPPPPPPQASAQHDEDGQAVDER